LIHKLTHEFTRVKGYFLPVFKFCRLIVTIYKIGSYKIIGEKL